MNVERNGTDSRRRPSGRMIRCVWCGYIVESLPHNRCPECGNAFDLAKPGNVVVSEKRIGVIGALRYLSRGAPLTSRVSRLEWAGLVCPRLPLAAIACAWVAAASVDTAFYWNEETLRIGMRDVPTVFVVRFPVHAFWAAAGILWLWGVVALLLRGTGACAELAKRGASRVNYFAAMLLPFGKAATAGFFTYDSPRNYYPAGEAAAQWCFVVVALARLAVIYQGVRKEPTGGTGVAFLAAMLCPDCWILLLIVGSALGVLR